MKTKVLIVEDQFIEANNLKIILRKAGYEVCKIARSVPQALAVIDEENPDLVLLDIHLDGELTGIDLAKLLKQRNIAFVYLSANSDEKILNAAKATKPYGFLVKPFREKDVMVMLDIAWYLHSHSLETDQQAPMDALKSRSEESDFPGIIGSSPNFVEVLNNVKIVASSEISVLILGESGTGKELIAKAIHRHSHRKNKPLVVVNCAALPANLIESELFGHEKGSFTGATEKRIGKFEQADGGTVFLDEIGELPLDLQVKFLRVLQEKEVEPIGGQRRPVNIRVIAATNRNLEKEMAAGRFRIDLFYRLNVFPISLPPLRDRQEDILPLATYFLNHYSKKENKTINGFSDPVIKSMLAYQWPGNVREVENLMERSVLLAVSPIIQTISLPTPKPLIRQDDDSRLKTMTENEYDHILAVLERCDWKLYGEGGAAEILQINASTLSSRMKKLGISKKTSYGKKD
jgi:two-component system, NtrC family, response regulator HydG